MRPVLLLLSPVADAPGATEYALNRAKELGTTLIAAVALDPDLTQRIDSALANVGFVGEKVGANVLEALAKEQHSLAEDRLAEVEVAAKAAGVACETLIEEGPPDDVCAHLIRTHQAVFAVLAAERRSWLTRLLSRGAAVNLPAFAGCEVIVIDH